jgi:hypothetical protein
MKLFTTAIGAMVVAATIGISTLAWAQSCRPGQSVTCSQSFGNTICRCSW